MRMTREDERILIRQAASGDRAAAAMIVRAHQQSVYAYLLRMSGRPDVAEDVTQEAFVRVLTNLDKFDPRYRFSTWLFTIARRLFINACQKKKPAYDSEMVGGWRGTGDAPEAPVLADEQQEVSRDALQRALMGLSDIQREIVVLFHQQDWPIALIAEHLEIPEGTVKSHLHRGRQRLRELMEHAEQQQRADARGVAR